MSSAPQGEIAGDPVNPPGAKCVGLYSFPKSGNTWLRAIVAAAAKVPAGRGMLHKYVTDMHYSRVIENPWEFNGTDWYFYKSHHMDLVSEHKGQTFRTDKIVYIYRNPLDVFLSYVNFVSKNVAGNAGKRLDFEINRVEDLTPAQMERLFSRWVAHATLFPQNKTFGSYFQNVQNFMDMRDRGGAVHVIRYEDLKDNFQDTVTGMLDFIGLEGADVQAVFEDADKRTAKDGKFFWKRASKNYETYLSPDQIARFAMVYEKELAVLGYDFSA
ncbi:MAG: sulfotransferase domain-containing protein [Pseudomonadota bacterium]